MIRSPSYVTRRRGLANRRGIGGSTRGLINSEHAVLFLRAAMTTDRRLRLWSLTVDQARGEPVRIRHVCAVVVSAAGVDGAAITVAVSAALRETVYASDPFATVLEQLILTLGEGPSVDAFSGGLVLVADLLAPECFVRWPVFAPAAVGAGVRAVFALPLQIGGIRLGVLDLYRARPGDLTREQLADALVLADTASALLLDAAEHRLEHPNEPGPEPAGGYHPEIHQATGMLIVQLGVTAAVALSRLRAHAYAHDRMLRDVAADVVARRLRFEPDV